MLRWRQESIARGRDWLSGSIEVGPGLPGRPTEAHEGEEIHPERDGRIGSLGATITVA
jgi:hypothetical protein